MKHYPMPPRFDALEGRTLLNADLAVTILGATGPNVMVPGDKGSIQVQLANVGNAMAVGSADMVVRASTNQTYDLTDPRVGVLDKTGKLAPGSHVVLTIPWTIPSDAPTGQYYLVVQVQSGLSSPDLNDANDVAATGTALPVVWQFGKVGNRTGVRLTLRDGQNPVTFALTGPGTGTVTDGGAGLASDTVTVTGSTSASAMTITTAKGLSTTVDAIQIRNVGGDGSIKSITAATINVASQVGVAGLIGSLTLRDVATSLVLNPTAVSVPPSAKASITLHSLHGGTMDTGGLPISSLKAEYIGRVDITAPSIDTMTLTSKEPMWGDFVNSTLTLESENTALGKLSVLGVMDGTTISTGGSIGSITAGNWSSGELTTNQLTSLKISGDMGATVGVAGLSTATIGANLSGNWSVLFAGKITVGGDMTGADLTVPGTIVGTPLPRYDNHITSLTVAGWIDSSHIHTLFPIGSVTAGGVRGSSLLLGVNGTDLPAAASDFDANRSGRFGSVTVKGIKDPATKQYVDSFIGSSIAAWEIDSLSLGNVDTDNSGAPFGIAAHGIGKLTYRHSDASNGVQTATGLTDPSDSWTEGDFALTIV